MSTRTETRVRVVINLLLAMFIVGLTLFVHGVVDDSSWQIVGIIMVAVSFSGVANIAAARR